MDVIPNKLHSLLPTIHENQIMSDHSVQQAALISLRNSFLKKYHGGKMTREQKQIALSKFLDCNTRCSTWEPDETSYYHALALRAKAKIEKQFYSGELQAPRISTAKATEFLRPGPGSSQGTKHMDFVHKLFHSDLTCTEPGLYKHYLENLPTRWRQAELIRRSTHKEVLVGGSKLNFAEKSAEEARIINTEANINMMYQLAHGFEIEGMLKEFYSIDLSKQPAINKAMARLGSLDQSFCTMDLRSASDSNGCRFMQWFLPPKIYQTLSAVRSPLITLPHEFGGGEVPLHIFSTMGNGFTFPLQTIVFASLVEACYDDLGIQYHQARQYSVFGDDIIVRPQAFYKLSRLLEYCGFTVNDAKSFSSGPFRESCGGDFFKGHDVRGIYLKDLSNDTQVFSLFNRLTRFAIRHSLDLTRILSCVFRCARAQLFIPFDLADTGGFKVPQWIAEERGQKPGKYTFFALPGRERRLNVDANPPGALVGILGGYVCGASRVSGPVTVTLRRRKTDRPVTRRGRTSSWDFVPHHGLMSRDYDFVYAIV